MDFLLLDERYEPRRSLFLDEVLACDLHVSRHEIYMLAVHCRDFESWYLRRMHSNAKVN